MFVGQVVITALCGMHKKTTLPSMRIYRIPAVHSFPSPTHSFIPSLKPSFSANPSLCSLSFSSSGLTTWFPRLLLLLLSISVFTFLVFLFYTFSCRFPCGRLSWLTSAFERMHVKIASCIVSYRIVPAVQIRCAVGMQLAPAPCHEPRWTVA